MEKDNGVVDGDETMIEAAQDQDSISAIERRRYKRVPAKVDIQYTILNKASVPRSTQSRDISGGGVRVAVTVGSDVQVGDELELRMGLVDEAMVTRDVTARAIVRWKRCLKGREKGAWEAGIEFLSFNERDRTRVINFVDHYDQWIADLRSKFGSRRVQNTKPKPGGGPTIITVKRPPRKK